MFFLATLNYSSQDSVLPVSFKNCFHFTSLDCSAAKVFWTIANVDLQMAEDEVVARRIRQLVLNVNVFIIQRLIADATKKKKLTKLYIICNGHVSWTSYSSN